MIPTMKGNIFYVHDLRSNVKSDGRDHVRDDGRDGEPSRLHFPFIYAGFRRSMVGMLGLLAKMVNRKNGWITQTPLSCLKQYLLLSHKSIQKWFLLCTDNDVRRCVANAHAAFSSICLYFFCFVCHFQKYCLSLHLE